MRSWTRKRVVVGIALTAAWAATDKLWAASATWDGDAAIGTSGDNATWSDANNWTTNGVVDTLPSNSAPGDDLTFGNGTAGGIIDLTAARVANSLTFNKNYTLGVAATALVLTNTSGNVSVDNGVTGTINAVLAGTAGLTKVGAGKVIINGANTFTGDITLNAGTLETNMAGGAATSPLGGQIGTTYRQLFFNNNATLRTTATWNDNTPSATNVGIVFNFTGDGTLDVSTGTLTIDDGAGVGTGAGNAQLRGSGTLTKTGSGILSLGNGSSNFDTFTGAIIVSAGTLQLGSGSNQFGTTAAGTTVQSGAVLNVQGNTTAEPLTISGSGISNGGALIGSGGTISGTVALAADSSVGGGGNLTLSNVVSGGFNLTKVGAGALILSGTNTYGGSTTIAGGSLRAAVGTGLPSTTNLILNGGAFEPTANYTASTGTGAGQVQITGGTSGFSGGLAAGVTVSLDSGAPLVWGSAAFNPSTLLLNQSTALGTVTLQNPIDLNGAARTFASNATTALPGIVSGAITSTGGATGVTITGSGVVQFTNTGNTGINSVTLTSGELGISADGNIGGASTPITFNGGGLQVNGTTLTSFGSHTVTFNTNKNIQFDITNAATTFTVGTTPVLTAGQILTKIGAGTLALTAPSNTVTTLSMNGGTLDLNGGTLNLSNGGGTTLLGTANSTINNGTLVISTAGGTNFGDNSVSSGVTLTINAKVSGADSTAGFEYCCSAGGTIVLNNPLNDFQGNVYINNAAATIATPSIGNQNATASGLGRGTTVNLNFAGARLQYTGTGETTDRIINLSAANSGAILDQSGPSGLLKFTTALSATGTGAKVLTLQGSTAGTAEFVGVIGNGSGTTGITKSGTGTWTLSGTNTYTGTTTLAGGVLAVSTAANLGASTAPFVFSGGTLRVTGNTLNNFGTRTVTFTSGVATGIDIADATNTFTLPGAVSLGANDFTKAGAGTLVMTGANSVRTLNANGGTIDLGGGTLTLNNSGANTIRGTADTTINNGTITISMNGTTGTNFGDNSVSSGVTLTINAKLTFASGAPTGFEYCCDSPGGTIALTNPANDFPGNVVLNSAGTVAAPAIGMSGATGPLGKGSSITLNAAAGARFLYTGTGETTDRQIVLANTQNILDASGTTTAGSPLKFSSPISVTNTAAKTFTLQGTGFGEVADVVPNNTAATSIVKAGTGTWVLSAANTYTGTTTVTAGTLLAKNTTGSATGTGAVTVNGTGTLGGSGTIAGPVTIAAGTAGPGGPAISPGSSAGILSTGSLALGSGSDAIFELFGPTAGTGYDQLNVTGTVNLGGADLIIAAVGPINVGDTFTIINNDGTADAVIGQFASGASVTGPNGSTFTIAYNGGDGNDVVLTTTAVPEPATVGLLGVAAAGLLARRRRRHSA